MANNKFGLKFPFTADNEDNLFLDLNTSVKDMVRSKIIHLIMTPKGNRLRMPEFGTDLIKYLFSQNDDITWSGIKNEASQSISKYIKNVTLDDIILEQDEHNTYVSLKILYDLGYVKEADEIKIKI